MYFLFLNFWHIQQKLNTFRDVILQVTSRTAVLLLLPKSVPHLVLRFKTYLK